MELVANGHKSVQIFHERKQSQHSISIHLKKYELKGRTYFSHKSLVTTRVQTPSPGVSASQTSLDKKTRPPSINFSAKKFASSQSMDSNATGVSGTSDFCKALYDYDATGSDEISFEEGKILHCCLQSFFPMFGLLVKFSL